MSYSMMQASLPMYDFPEIREVTDAWWRGIAKHMKQQGIANVPEFLIDGIPLDELWKQENLFLSQCCGFNIVRGYDKHLSVLMVTDWDVEGCEPHQYASYVVVHEDSPYDTISQLKDKIAVINDPESHSGMTTLMHEVQPFSLDGQFFKEIHISEAHVESLNFIQTKRADVAAIDCVTFALLKRYRPAVLEGIRIIARSKAAPALPYVTSINTSLETQHLMQAALAGAFADPDLAELREAQLLRGAYFPKLVEGDNPYKEIADGFQFDSRLLDSLVIAETL